MLKRNAPEELMLAVERNLKKWPRCRCKYPCEIRKITLFKRLPKELKVFKAVLACVADECNTTHTILFSR